MLSAETSVGKFPVVAVHTMAHTAEVTEDFQDKNLPETADPPRLSRRGDPSAALARAAWRTVNDLDAKLVVIWSQSGMTARVFSKHHFHCPLIAISSDQRVLRRMAIHYGVVPQLMERPESTAEMFERIDKMLIARKYAQEGDRIIIVAGWSPTTPDTMNGIIVHSVGDKWAPISPTGSSVNREGK